MITVRHKGNFNRIEKFFNKVKDFRNLGLIEKLNEAGRQGVEALSAATPVDSGKTASSWEYEIIEEAGRYKIQFNNTNINKGVNIAIIIQTGHGTRNGGWVEGKDYINPATEELLTNMADDLWREVTKA